MTAAIYRVLPRIFSSSPPGCQAGRRRLLPEWARIAEDRQFNRRFLRMCSHYLVEPTACTPASGWEKGQVENQVGVVRERFFTPRLRVASGRRRVDSQFFNISAGVLDIVRDWPT